MTAQGSTMESDPRTSEVSAADQTQTDNQAMESVIRPLVLDRWKGLIRRGKYTPNEVAAVLAGSPFNRLQNLMAMFEMMEESWPRLGKNLHEIRTSVSRLEYDVHPFKLKGKDPTPSAQEKAKFVERALFGFHSNPLTGQNGFNDMVYDLLDAYGKGLSVLEIDWQRGPAGEYLPQGTRWIKPCYYDYPYKAEETERLMLCPDGQNTNDLIEFPEHKFIVGRFAWRSGALATTQGMLRMLAPWWVYTNFATEWLMQFAQIFGIPMRIAKYTNAGSIKAISDMLDKMGACGHAVLPSGTEFELHEAAHAGGDNPNAYILEHTDNLADIIILGNTLTSNVSSTGGNRALGEVHERTQEGRVGSCAQWVADTLTNQLIRSMLILNYGNDDELPELKQTSEEETNEEKIVVDKVLFSDMGLPVSKEYLYNRYNVPVPAETDDLFKPVAQAAAEAGLALQQAALDQKANQPPQAQAAPGQAAPGQRPAGQTALAAKVAGMEIPQVVMDALAELPEDMQDHYVLQIKAKAAHYPHGQPGGGQFMASDVKAAQDKLLSVIESTPIMPGTPGLRKITAFGMADNSDEFAMKNKPDMMPMVTDMARSEKATQAVAIKDLSTTKGTIDTHKLMSMLADSQGAAPEPVHKSPIVAVKDGRQWLLDGHHRAAKAMLMGKTDMQARVVKMV